MADRLEQAPIGGELSNAIERAVRKIMSGFEVRSVEIAAGEDHDGDPVLFVEVNHDLSGTPVDPRILSSLVVQIRNELAEAGETRFPLIRHHFAEKQKVVGFP